MRHVTNAVSLVASLVAIVPLCASEIGSATFSPAQIDATHFHYDLRLNDIGTTNVGTFWFAWVPGEDFMPTSPTNILSPASWTFTITSGGASDGFAIRWVAAPGSALAPGQFLTGFGFDSTTTPAQLSGLSQFFNHPPVTTSVIYSAGPFSDAGFQFNAQQAAAPEPSTLVMIAFGGAALAATRRRRA